MKCPHCDLGMLSSTRGGASQPRVCASCGGIWVPRGKVEQIHESELLYSLLASDDDEGDVDALACPAGHGIMSRARVELDPPFRLDRCSRCHGIWFDRGEWEKLSASHLAEQLPELWSRSWQRRQRRERSQQRYLDWARERFGDELAAELQRVSEALRDHPHRSEALAFVREMSSAK